MQAKPADQGALATIGKASVIGLHMVSGVLVGGFLGWLLDDWLGTSPLMLCLFFVFGVAAGFLNVRRDVRSIMRAQTEQDALVAATKKDAMLTATTQTEKDEACAATTQTRQAAMLAASDKAGLSATSEKSALEAKNSAHSTPDSTPGSLHPHSEDSSRIRKTHRPSSKHS